MDRAGVTDRLGGFQSEEIVRQRRQHGRLPSGRSAVGKREGRGSAEHAAAGDARSWTRRLQCAAQNVRNGIPNDSVTHRARGIMSLAHLRLYELFLAVMEKGTNIILF